MPRHISVIIAVGVVCDVICGEDLTELLKRALLTVRIDD